MEGSIQTQIEATTLEIATCTSDICNVEASIESLMSEDTLNEQQQHRITHFEKKLEGLRDREKGLRAQKLLETQGLLAANTTGAPPLSRCRSVSYSLIH